MAVGAKPCGMAQWVVVKWLRRPFGAPGFRNVCLAVLAVVSVVVASGLSGPPPAANTKTEPELPNHLPPYTPPASEEPFSLPSTLPPLDIAPKPSKPGSMKPAPKAGTLPLPSPSRSPSKGTTANRPPFDFAPRSACRRRQASAGSGHHAGNCHRSAAPVELPGVPKRIALTVNETDPVASLKEVPHKDREWYLHGKKPGTAFLDVWLPDKTNATLCRVLHYLIRVLPNPADKRELETLYETLEGEINRTFPGCVVHLKRTDDTLVVSGTARNIFEATRILNIARENAPGPRSESGRPALKSNEAAPSSRRRCKPRWTTTPTPGDRASSTCCAFPASSKSCCVSSSPR